MSRDFRKVARMQWRNVASTHSYLDGRHVGVLDVEGRALRLERVESRRLPGVELFRLEVVVAQHLRREGSVRLLSWAFFYPDIRSYFQILCCT